MKLLPSLLLSAATLLTLSACESYVSLDERYRAEDGSFEPQRTVLIEEFTGQSCVNCPEAHELLNEFKETFNSEEKTGVISVGIHIRQFGTDFPAGFVTPEGREYSKDVESAPSARINRRTGIINSDKWLASIFEEIQRKPSLKFTSLEAIQNPDGQSLSVSGTIELAENVKSSKLQLWLVEDNVTGIQLMPGNAFNLEYPHHSVFRNAINGVNGQSIELKLKDQTNFKVESYPIHEKYNPENLRVVAFVYNESDGVLNAAQTQLRTLE